MGTISSTSDKTIVKVDFKFCGRLNGRRLLTQFYFNNFFNIQCIYISMQFHIARHPCFIRAKLTEEETCPVKLYTDRILSKGFHT